MRRRASIRRRSGASERGLFTHWEQYFLIALLLAALYGAFRILLPYLHALILAALISSIFYPVHMRLLRWTRGHANTAALLTCALVALVVLLPLGVFCSALVYKGIDSFNAVQDWIAAGKLKEAMNSERLHALVASPRLQPLFDIKARYLPGMSLESLNLTETLLRYTRGLLSYLGGHVLPFLNNVFVILLNFILMLFTMFYFFRDGEKILDFVLRLCPMSNAHETRLIERIKAVGKSALLGSLLTAGTQAALAMIAFAVVGIQWFFWGVMLGVASLIPVVGTALIWVPSVAYLLIVGKTAAAIGLAVYCLVVVGGADNLLRPMFMQGDTGLSSMLLFFSLIGGIQLFGIMGVIYGPLIFGICAVLLYIYDLEARPTSSSTPRHAR